MNCGEQKIVASFDIGEKNFAYSIGTSDKLIAMKHCNVLKKKTQSVIDSCKYVTEEILNVESPSWYKCDAIIIEQQMKYNVRAQRLAQHVWTWFYTVHPSKIIEFVPSRLKTQHFIGKNVLSDKERKKWSVVKCTEILTEQNDTEHLSYMSHLKKKDDVADTYLQLIAWAAAAAASRQPKTPRKTTRTRPRMLPPIIITITSSSDRLK